MDTCKIKRDVMFGLNPKTDEVLTGEIRYETADEATRFRGETIQEWREQGIILIAVSCDVRGSSGVWGPAHCINQDDDE